MKSVHVSGGWWRKKSGELWPFLGGALAVIVGWPVCFIAMMTFIAVVSPPLISSREFTIFIAIMSFGIVVVVYFFVWPVVYLKDSKFDNLVKDERGLRLGIQDFRKRSRRHRRMSVSALFLMFWVALLGFTATAARFDEQQSGAARFVEQQSGALAALVLLVVLIRVLALVYRYNLRLSSFYDARADYLCLTGKKKAFSHKELLELVDTNEVDATSIKEFWRSLFGRSSFHETKDTKPPSS